MALCKGQLSGVRRKHAVAHSDTTAQRLDDEGTYNSTFYSRIKAHFTPELRQSDY